LIEIERMDEDVEDELEARKKNPKYILCISRRDQS